MPVPPYYGVACMVSVNHQCHSVNVSDFPIVASICHSATARWAAVALSSSVYVLGEVTSSRVMKTSPVSIRG